MIEAYTVVSLQLPGCDWASFSSRNGLRGESHPCSPVLWGVFS